MHFKDEWLKRKFKIDQTRRKFIEFPRPLSKIVCVSAALKMQMQFNVGFLQILCPRLNHCLLYQFLLVSRLHVAKCQSR